MLLQTRLFVGPCWVAAPMKSHPSLNISERNDNHMNVASSDQLKTELVKSEQLHDEIAAAIREKVPKVSQLA